MTHALRVIEELQKVPTIKDGVVVALAIEQGILGVLAMLRRIAYEPTTSTQRRLLDRTALYINPAAMSDLDNYTQGQRVFGDSA